MNGPADGAKYARERDVAFAVAALSLVLSVALVLDTFAGKRSELVKANRQITELQATLRGTEDALAKNEKALLEAQRVITLLQVGDSSRK